MKTILISRLIDVRLGTATGFVGRRWGSERGREAKNGIRATKS
jgi:hypothetical protein